MKYKKEILDCFKDIFSQLIDDNLYFSKQLGFYYELHLNAKSLESHPIFEFKSINLKNNKSEKVAEFQVKFADNSFVFESKLATNKDITKFAEILMNFAFALQSAFEMKYDILLGFLSNHNKPVSVPNEILSRVKSGEVLCFEFKSNIANKVKDMLFLCNDSITTQEVEKFILLEDCSESFIREIIKDKETAYLANNSYVSVPYSSSGKVKMPKRISFLRSGVEFEVIVTSPESPIIVKDNYLNKEMTLNLCDFKLATCLKELEVAHGLDRLISNPFEFEMLKPHIEAMIAKAIFKKESNTTLSNIIYIEEAATQMKNSFTKLISKYTSGYGNSFVHEMHLVISGTGKSMDDFCSVLEQKSFQISTNYQDTHEITFVRFKLAEVFFVMGYSLSKKGFGGKKLLIEIFEGDAAELSSYCKKYLMQKI